MAGRGRRVPSHLIYDWKAKRALVEVTDSLTPNDSVQLKSDPITRHCSKVGVASV